MHCFHEKRIIIALLLAVMLCMGSVVSVQAVAPEGYPPVIDGLDFGGKVVYIYDWWSDGTRSENPTDDQLKQYEYWDWLEDTYNVTIKQTALSDWEGNPAALAEMVANKDDSELCIVGISGGFAGGPLANDLYMPWTYGLDSGAFDQNTLDYMTKGGVTYGVSYGDSVEPRQGVFFNKRVLEEAGIDWNELYDLQASGDWTWEKMEQYMGMVQMDKDNDGQLDVWALTGNGDDVTIGLVVSNDADFYGYNDDGLLVPTIESAEMKEALQRRIDWGSQYMRPTEQWDDYQRFWAEGSVAFMIGQSYEGFNGNGTVNQCADDWGFLALPKGPRSDHYMTTEDNNVYGIPNVYDQATALKLEQLFTLYSMTPGISEDAWSANFSGLTDERAINETYAMLRQSEYATILNYNLLGDRNSTVTEIMWNLGGGTVEEIVESALQAFQERCDEFNKANRQRLELVSDFVQRCYSLILSRNADEAGLEFWITALMSGQSDASKIIKGFVNSVEFKGKALTEEEKVEIIYNTMLGRSSDPAGKAHWAAYLYAGNPIEVIIKGFCASPEFTGICKKYGINPGTVVVDEIKQPKADIEKVKAFVSRCYSLILSRDPDPSGLSFWTKKLASDASAASEIIDRFVNSVEFKGKNLSNEEAVEILYNTMLGRGSDPAGKAHWIAKLEAGYPYAAIINGFCVSSEFTGICNTYGIKPGSVNVEDFEVLNGIGAAADMMIGEAAETADPEVKDETGLVPVEIVLSPEVENENLGTAVQVIYVGQ